MNHPVGKEALLRATISVVARGGLRALTYRAVAAEAGVSHSLVRHHFGSRDQLIAQAMHYAIDVSLRDTNMLEREVTVAEFAAGIESLSQQDSDVQAFQYEMLLESRRKPELAEIVRMHYRAYRDVIKEQFLHLGIDDEEFADLIWFVLDGIVFNQLVIPGDVEPVLRRLRLLIESQKAPKK